MFHESVHFLIEIDHAIANLWLNDPPFQNQRFDLKMLTELEFVIHTLNQNEAIDLVVLRGRQPGCFDIQKPFMNESEEEARFFSGRGQQVLQALENLGKKIPTVALIEGRCRGAGLELALACRFRLTTQSPFTTMDFDFAESRLIPCWGTISRLVSIVGARQAQELLGFPHRLSSLEAKRLGLGQGLLTQTPKWSELRSLVDEMQDALERVPFSSGILNRLSQGLGRGFGSLVPGNSGDGEEGDFHRGLNQILRAVSRSSGEALVIERSVFGEMVRSESVQRSQELRRISQKSLPLYPQLNHPLPSLPDRIGIVGVTAKSLDLAYFFAERGIRVALQVGNEEKQQDAHRQILAILKGRCQRGFLSKEQGESTLDRIRISLDWQGFDRVDWVIDASEQELGPTLETFVTLESITAPRTILTTLSATIPVTLIQQECSRPQRIVGLTLQGSFSEMTIIEMVRGGETDLHSLTTIEAWLREWEKTPLLVSDRPGRILQRLLFVYLSEAVHLISEGLTPELLDAEIRRAGMAQGPFEWIDQIGFDQLAKWAEEWELALGDSSVRNLRFERFRALGWNGKSSGEGFYSYRGQRKWPNQMARMVSWRDQDDDCTSHYIFDEVEALQLGVDRLMLRVINEGARCLEEEPDLDPQRLDLACSWGLDLFPEHGGPLRFADEWGLNRIEELLLDFADRFGKRFEPSLELQRRVEGGESFYGTPRPIQVRPPLRRAG